MLIIEEINRANVAAVFGDVFQLLDRGSNFVSEYPIQATEDIKKYLAKELGGKPEDYNKIKIPDNMFIWATMNSADQGVFPMDTAFKRRWDFTYLGIDDNDKELQGKFVTIGSKEKQRIEWNELRKAINEFLAEAKINEDKQLGPYFISKSIVIPKDGGTEIDSKLFCDAFKNKVLNQALKETVAVQNQQIVEMKPKASYYDVVLNCKDLVAISVIAKDYGWSANRMNQYLHQKGVQYKQGNKIWLLYQKYAEMGYTNTKTHSYPGNYGTMHTAVHTYWTQQGRLFIYELLKSDGILPTMEQED